MAEKNYLISINVYLGGINPSKLHNEIVLSNLILGFEGIVIEGNNLKVVYNNSIIDEGSLDSLIFSHVATSLTDNKQKRCNDIDTKTQMLIAQGFNYMGVQLSLSITAQSNGHAFQVSSLKSWGTFPKKISTMADGELLLNTQAELDGYYTTGLGTAKYFYDTGRTLKVAVNVSTTQAELDAVVDNR